MASTATMNREPWAFALPAREAEKRWLGQIHEQDGIYSSDVGVGASGWTSDWPA